MEGVAQISQIDPRRQALLEARFEGIQRPILPSNNQMNTATSSAQINIPNSQAQGKLAFLWCCENG
jgi:hypothetical protein